MKVKHWRRKWGGFIQGGELRFKDGQAFQDGLAKLPDGDVMVTLENEVEGRSLNQNSYYWGVVITMISEEMGEIDLEYTHSLMAYKFLSSYRDVIIKNKTYQAKRVQSTTELSTVEFEDYMSKVRMWASKYLHVFIPLPNEVQF